MDYPKNLKPNRAEKYILENVEFEIPVVDLTLKRWEGESIQNTFGGKPLIEYKNEPMFAELAVQRLAGENGDWQSRWVETYACKGSGPYYFTDWKDAKLSEQVVDPLNNSYLENLLKEISVINNNLYSGCWDVLIWKNDTPIFIELKRNKKDFVRGTQLKWLKAALAYGLTLDNFMIVQWDFD